MSNAQTLSALGSYSVGSSAGNLVTRDSGGMVGGILQSTTVATTSGTSIDVTGIPSTAKRITVLLANVSSSGTSPFLIQVGSGSVQTTGYNSAGSKVIAQAGPALTGSTAGFVMQNDNAGDVHVYRMQIELAGSNVYVSSHVVGGNTNRAMTGNGAGAVTTSGAVDRVRLTTINGTDTFDSGSMTVLWES